MRGQCAEDDLLGAADAVAQHDVVVQEQSSGADRHGSCFFACSRSWNRTRSAHTPLHRLRPAHERSPACVPRVMRARVAPSSRASRGACGVEQIGVGTAPRCNSCPLHPVYSIELDRAPLRKAILRKAIRTHGGHFAALSNLAAPPERVANWTTSASGCNTLAARQCTTLLRTDGEGMVEPNPRRHVLCDALCVARFAVFVAGGRADDVLCSNVDFSVRNQAVVGDSDGGALCGAMLRLARSSSWPSCRGWSEITARKVRFLTHDTGRDDRCGKSDKCYRLF